MPKKKKSKKNLNTQNVASKEPEAKGKLEARKAELLAKRKATFLAKPKQTEGSSLRVPRIGDSEATMHQLTQQWTENINNASTMEALVKITLTLGEVDDPDSIPFLENVNDAIQTKGQSINLASGKNEMIPSLIQNITEAKEALERIKSRNRY